MSSGQLRPKKADLRTKLENPEESLGLLYESDYRITRSKKSLNYLALVEVEQYIIYLEKKVANLEKKEGVQHDK